MSRMVLDLGDSSGPRGPGTISELSSLQLQRLTEQLLGSKGQCSKAGGGKPGVAAIGTEGRIPRERRANAGQRLVKGQGFPQEGEHRGSWGKGAAERESKQRQHQLRSHPQQNGGAKQAKTEVKPEHLAQVDDVEAEGLELAQSDVELELTASEASDGEGGTRQTYDSMPGCSKCSFSRTGCSRCIAKPLVTRPHARYKPQEGRPQHVPEAPTYYPTEEEFKDPFTYINSIREEACKFGIARIVPPSSWQPPFALNEGTNGESASSFKFTTRRQYTSHLSMRAPRGFAAGDAAEHDSSKRTGRMEQQQAGTAAEARSPTARSGQGRTPGSGSQRVPACVDKQAAMAGIELQVQQLAMRFLTPPAATGGNTGCVVQRALQQQHPDFMSLADLSNLGGLPVPPGTLGFTHGHSTRPRNGGRQPSVDPLPGGMQHWQSAMPWAMQGAAHRLWAPPVVALSQPGLPVPCIPPVVLYETHKLMPPRLTSPVVCPRRSVVPQVPAPSAHAPMHRAAAASPVLSDASCSEGGGEAAFAPVACSYEARLALYGPFLQPHPLIAPLLSRQEVKGLVQQSRRLLGLPRRPKPAALCQTGLPAWDPAMLQGQVLGMAVPPSFDLGLGMEGCLPGAGLYGGGGTMDESLATMFGSSMSSGGISVLDMGSSLGLSSFGGLWATGVRSTYGGSDHGEGVSGSEETSTEGLSQGESSEEWEELELPSDAPPELGMECCRLPWAVIAKGPEGAASVLSPQPPHPYLQIPCHPCTESKEQPLPQQGLSQEEQLLPQHLQAQEQPMQQQLSQEQQLLQLMTPLQADHAKQLLLGEHAQQGEQAQQGKRQAAAGNDSDDSNLTQERGGRMGMAATMGHGAGHGCLVGEDDVFGHGYFERKHTLTSFEAYADWVKALHFRMLPRPHPPRPRVTGQGRQPWGNVAKVKIKPTSAGGVMYRRRLPSAIQVEGEFWRLLEAPVSGRVVETLYGSDLDSGRHGSGFPLPAWRGVPTDSKSGEPLLLDAHAEEYSRHAWNINNMTRSAKSMLRYVKCDDLVTGVMVPWLYVGSCMSAFCWHIEDHSFYSINYLHVGSPKVWYGVPATSSLAFEVAMRDALPHLFEEDPLLLHRLVTMLSPCELRARGVPVHRLVHEEGSFVVTFPGAYHAGFNTGFNVAEAVNFAPPDWLPFGTDVVRKLRAQSKAPTLSHDMLLLSVVGAASLVAAKAGLLSQKQQEEQQEQHGQGQQGPTQPTATAAAVPCSSAARPIVTDMEPGNHVLQPGQHQEVLQNGVRVEIASATSRPVAVSTTGQQGAGEAAHPQPPNSPSSMDVITRLLAAGCDLELMALAGLDLHKFAQLTSAQRRGLMTEGASQAGQAASGSSELLTLGQTGQHKGPPADRPRTQTQASNSSDATTTTASAPTPATSVGKVPSTDKLVSVTGNAAGSTCGVLTPTPGNSQSGAQAAVDPVEEGAHASPAAVQLSLQPSTVQASTPHWMSQWKDGITLSDAPIQGVILGVGELAVRLDEEKRRLAVARSWGVVQEQRMDQLHFMSKSPSGLFTSTADCDCLTCKCDLYLSAVVSHNTPGLCTCPEHAADLGAPPERCILLYRHPMEEMEQKVEQALELFPQAKEHMDKARARVAAQPTALIRRLGPIVVLEGLDSKFLSNRDPYEGISIVDPFQGLEVGENPAVLIPPEAPIATASALAAGAGSKKGGGRWARSNTAAAAAATTAAAGRASLSASPAKANGRAPGSHPGLELDLRRSSNQLPFMDLHLPEQLHVSAKLQPLQMPGDMCLPLELQQALHMPLQLQHLHLPPELLNLPADLYLPSDLQHLHMSTDQQMLMSLPSELYMPTELQQLHMSTDQQQMLMPTELYMPTDLQQLHIPSDLQQLQMPSDPQQLQITSDLQQLQMPSDLQQLQMPSDLQQLQMSTDLQQLQMPTELQGLHMPTQLQILHMPAQLQRLHIPSQLQQLHMPAELLLPPELAALCTALGGNSSRSGPSAPQPLSARTGSSKAPSGHSQPTHSRASSGKAAAGAGHSHSARAPPPASVPPLKGKSKRRLPVSEEEDEETEADTEGSQDESQEPTPRAMPEPLGKRRRVPSARAREAAELKSKDLLGEGGVDATAGVPLDETHSMAVVSVPRGGKGGKRLVSKPVAAAFIPLPMVLSPPPPAVPPPPPPDVPYASLSQADLVVPPLASLAQDTAAPASMLAAALSPPVEGEGRPQRKRKPSLKNTTAHMTSDYVVELSSWHAPAHIPTPSPIATSLPHPAPSASQQTTSAPAPPPSAFHDETSSYSMREESFGGGSLPLPLVAHHTAHTGHSDHTPALGSTGKHGSKRRAAVDSSSLMLPSLPTPLASLPGLPTPLPSLAAGLDLSSLNGIGLDMSSLNGANCCLSSLSSFSGAGLNMTNSGSGLALPNLGASLNLSNLGLGLDLNSLGAGLGLSNFSTGLGGLGFGMGLGLWPPLTGGGIGASSGSSPMVMLMPVATVRGPTTSRMCRGEGVMGSGSGNSGARGGSASPMLPPLASPSHLPHLGSLCTMSVGGSGADLPLQLPPPLPLSLTAVSNPSAGPGTSGPQSHSQELAGDYEEQEPACDELLVQPVMAPVSYKAQTTGAHAVTAASAMSMGAGGRSSPVQALPDGMGKSVMAGLDLSGSGPCPHPGPLMGMGSPLGRTSSMARAGQGDPAGLLALDLSMGLDVMAPPPPQRTGTPSLSSPAYAPGRTGTPSLPPSHFSGLPRTATPTLHLGGQGGLVRSGTSSLGEPMHVLPALSPAQLEQRKPMVCHAAALWGLGGSRVASPAMAGQGCVTPSTGGGMGAGEGDMDVDEAEEAEVEDFLA